MTVSARQPTDFESRVYQQLKKIPCGKVATYASLARALGCRSAQAIGQALKRNPYAPEVPCHRVIKANLTIGGYSGATSGAKLKKKLQLLQQEGVEFDSEGKLVTLSALIQFD